MLSGWFSEIYSPKKFNLFELPDEQKESSVNMQRNYLRMRNKSFACSYDYCDWSGNPPLEIEWEVIRKIQQKTAFFGVLPSVFHNQEVWSVLKYFRRLGIVTPSPSRSFSGFFMDRMANYEKNSAKNCILGGFTPSFLL